MQTDAPTHDYDIVLIGGGASGVMTAIQLLRLARGPRRLLLVEPGNEIGEGVAYATRRPEHLLNVPAGKMSAFPDQPDDFLDYLRGADCLDAPADALAGRYAPRLHYAAYLRQRLAQARQASAATLEVSKERVQWLRPEVGGAGLCLGLGEDVSLRAAAVVLAVGNAPRPLPLRGAATLAASQCVEAWDSEAVAALSAEASLCVIGSGLSMVDAAITRDRQSQRAPLHVLSRHGLMPLPRADVPPLDFDPQPLLAMGLRQRLRHLRALAAQAQRRGQPWQAVMERLRPWVQALWQSLDEADQRRFLRHAVRYWDVHRHCIEPSLHARLQAMRERGALRLHRARPDAAWSTGACVQIEARERGGAPLRLEAQCLLNATGLEMRVQAMRSPLLQQLLGEGHAVPGPHGIGIDTDPAGCLRDAQGHADPRIRVIGSLRVGRLWESLAVPELRVQAADIARALSD